MPKDIRTDLGQYMTPEWAARELFEHFAGDTLGPGELVLEPSCGQGAFLKAVPDDTPAVGVEIDPFLAQSAARNSGREIIVGDFRTVAIPYQPTLIVGNPPYQVDLFNDFLDRCRQLLPDGGRAGFLISTHIVQTPNTVLAWREHWSISQQIVPRTLFPGSIRPLTFVVFTRERLRRLYGFLLYPECQDLQAVTADAKVLLVTGKAGQSCWRAVVDWAIREAGGRATLPEIYERVMPRRPSTTDWWKEKIRQVCQQHFKREARGVWAVAN